MWWVPLLLIYGVTACLTAAITLGKVVWQEDEDFILNRNPNQLYNSTEVNYFGWIITWIDTETTIMR